MKNRLLNEITKAAYECNYDKAAEIYLNHRCIDDHSYHDAIQAGNHQRTLYKIKCMTDQLKKVMPVIQAG